MNKNYKVYKHTFPNNKVYIGITCQDTKLRWRHGGTGYSDSPLLYNAILKYGWDNIKHEILFNNLTQDEACQLERKLIKEYNSSDWHFGYNLTTGGEKHTEYNEMTRKKISDKVREYNSSLTKEDRKAWYIKRNQDFMQSPEYKKKLSEASKKVWASGKCDHLKELNRQTTTSLWKTSEYRKML